MKKRVLIFSFLLFALSCIYSYPAMAATGPKTAGKNGADAGQSKDASCAGFTGEQKTTCRKAYDDRVIAIAKKKGREGAAAKNGKNAACAYPSGSKRLKECRKAYDKEVIVVSTREGKEAGESGGDSPCAKLPWGVKAKQACTKAYKTGQKKAGSKGRNDCGGVDTYFKFDCGSTNKDAAGNVNPIYKLALEITGWITGFVAVAVVGGIVYGGFLYMTANDNSSQTKQGVMVVINAIVALLLLMMAFAIINFIVPGGLFG